MADQKTLNVQQKDGLKFDTVQVTPDDLDVTMNRESGFKHPKMDPKNQVRLIEVQPLKPEGSIQCQFHIANVLQPNGEMNLQYKALSYTWGRVAAMEDLHAIILEGSRFYVRTNLWQFLEQASQAMAGTLFFIDALCIDQANMQERGHQVQLMSSLYYRALEVVIWLGLPDKDPILHDGLASLQGRSDWGKTDDATDTAESSALDFLAERPYWTRIWIVQEIILAAEIRVLLGQYEFPWATLASLKPKSVEFPNVSLDSNGELKLWHSFVRGRPYSVNTNPLLHIIEHKNRWDSPNYVYGMASKLPVEPSTPNQQPKQRAAPVIPAYIALTAFGSQQCSNPRDKLYGVLGLIEESLREDVLPKYDEELRDVYLCALLTCAKSALYHAKTSQKMFRACGWLAAQLHEIFGLKEDDIWYYRKVFFSELFLPWVDSIFSSVNTVDCDHCSQPRGITSCPNHQKLYSDMLAPFLSLAELCSTSQPLGNLSRTWMAGKESIELEAADRDERFAYTVRSIALWTTEGLHNTAFLGMRVDDTIADVGLQETTVYDMVAFDRGREELSELQDEQDMERYKLALHVRGPAGSYYLRMAGKQEKSGSWSELYIDDNATPARHEANCDQCAETIVGVRFRCLDCADYDLCYSCSREASRSHEGHVLEPVFYPLGSTNWLIRAGPYLGMNFWRIAYHIPPDILDDLQLDPQAATAIQGVPAGGMMFPWRPRKEVDPPYWVANLDCTGHLAADGIPHLRCMGLRLQNSDPIDAPPKIMPPGYRFFGQVILEAINKARSSVEKEFGNDLLTHPRHMVAELALQICQDKEIDMEKNYLFPLDVDSYLTDEEYEVDKSSGEPLKISVLSIPVAYFDINKEAELSLQYCRGVTLSSIQKDTPIII